MGDWAKLRRLLARWVLPIAGLPGCHSAAPPAVRSSPPAHADGAQPASAAIASAPPQHAEVTSSSSPSACRVEAPGSAGPLKFAWQKAVARGEAAWISDLWADEQGVFVAGADASSRTGAQPFVASFAASGQERFRVPLAGIAISRLKPARASALALAGEGAGSVYVLTSAVQPDGLGSRQLTLLGAKGSVRFSAPLEDAAAHVVVDSRGAAIVSGAVGVGALAVAKYTSEGTRVWSHRYEYGGDEPLLTTVGDHLLLAASLHGSAQLGARVTHSDTFRYRCAQSQTDCEAVGHALLVVELDALGMPVQSNVFGGASSDLALSGLALLADGRLLLTGEFQGPPTALAAVSLCEMQPGMPGVEASVFHEAGSAAAGACRCRKDQRDLFLLQLSRELQPLWAKTLALGEPKPQVARAASGMVWAARLTSSPAGATSSDRDGGQLALWSLSPAGDVTARRTVAGGFKLMTAAGGGAVYLSDGRSVQRATVGDGNE